MSEPGERWSVAECYRWTENGVLVAEGFKVADREGQENQALFVDKAAAIDYCAELNRADVERVRDPAFADRRARLRDLGETFWVSYGTGPREARWPERPERYAVEEFSERYMESFWGTVDTLEEVEDLVRDGGVGRVVDLDSGEEIAFEVTVRLGSAVRLVCA